MNVSNDRLRHFREYANLLGLGNGKQRRGIGSASSGDEVARINVTLRDDPTIGRNDIFEPFERLKALHFGFPEICR